MNNNNRSGADARDAGPAGEPQGNGALAPGAGDSGAGEPAGSPEVERYIERMGQTGRIPNSITIIRKHYRLGKLDATKDQTTNALQNKDFHDPNPRDFMTSNRAPEVVEVFATYASLDGTGEAFNVGSPVPVPGVLWHLIEHVIVVLSTILILLMRRNQARIARTGPDPAQDPPAPGAPPPGSYPHGDGPGTNQEPPSNQGT
ncbi:hypothetical protein QBC41DRAFT_301020 [Cercophora samala]|uniref:Uncharacterized protein n=1 Tax=Cercophora samala TaxID=330535 RepID=A0AA40DDF9_9PEZI|nr:hypothetical protein QBC41DRAFT_301020 [Cercophora samala]